MVSRYNLHYSMGGGGDPGAEYTDLLKAVYLAIKMKVNNDNFRSTQ